MGSVLKFALFGKQPAEVWMSTPSPSLREATFLRTLGWLSAGAGALTLGLFVGRELRSRYKFNRRTPYDFYAHSGDTRDLECGVGI